MHNQYYHYNKLYINNDIVHKVYTKRKEVL